jgi:GMP synthase (glutamine-hydrolysing)
LISEKQKESFMTKPILIVKTGTTMPHLAKRRGDFDDWFQLHLQCDPNAVTVVSPFVGDSLPTPESFSGVIVTGSHAMVTDREPWSEKTAAWLPSVIEAGIPLLGICYGHQLLAHAMGGIVASCPIGIELGTVDILLNNNAPADQLFGEMPDSFKAHASHTQSVIQLPPDAIPLAFNDNEPHHAFSIGKFAWGIQFHPEFDADIMKTYIGEFSDMLEAHGQNRDKASAEVVETPHSSALLLRFKQIAMTE